MKTFPIFASFSLCLFCLLPVAASDLVISSSRSGPAVYNSTDTAKVPNGSLVQVGMLNAGVFTVFGTTTVKSAGIPANAVPGKIAGSVVPVGPDTTHSQFNSKPVYIRLFNAPTEAAATESTLLTTSVVFPINDVSGVGDSLTISIGSDVVAAQALLPWAAGRITTGVAPDALHFVLGVPFDADHDGIEDAWEIANGMSTASSNDSTKDTDGDGLDSRMEYALGSSPTSSSPAALPAKEVVTAGGVPYEAICFHRRKGLTGMSLVPEISSDLGGAAWQNMIIVSVVDQGATEMVVVRDPMPRAQRNRAFYRLRLSVP